MSMWKHKKASKANNRREELKVPAIDQFITWCNAINSCFSVLRDVDTDTISEEKNTSKTYYYIAAKVSS